MITIKLSLGEGDIASDLERELKKQILAVIPHVLNVDTETYFVINISSRFAMMVEHAPMGMIMHHFFGYVGDCKDDHKTLIYSTDDVDYRIELGSIAEVFGKWIRESYGVDN